MCTGGALAGTRLGVLALVTWVKWKWMRRNTQGKVPSYTVVDLSVGYDLGEASDTLSGATANLLVNNLFSMKSTTPVTTNRTVGSVLSSL